MRLHSNPDQMTPVLVTSYVDGADESQEERDGVGGQFGLQSLQETLKIKLGSVLHNGGHPGLPLHPGNVHPVDDAVHLLQDGADDGLHLHGGDVLPPPPVGVAHPVNKVHPAKLVSVEQVSRSKQVRSGLWTDYSELPEVHVSLPEHISDDLPAGGLLANVALEVPGRMPCNTEVVVRLSLRTED